MREWVIIFYFKDRVSALLQLLNVLWVHLGCCFVSLEHYGVTIIKYMHCVYNVYITTNVHSVNIPDIR